MAKGQKKAGPKPKVLEETLKKQITALTLLGRSRNAIAKELNISPYFVNRTWKSDEFKKELRQLADDTTAAAKDTIRVRMSDLANDVLDVLSYQLKDKRSIEAVKVALKVIGFDQEEKVKQDTNIQVVLPGTVEKEVISDVGSTVQNEED